MFKFKCLEQFMYLPSELHPENNGELYFPLLYKKTILFVLM